MVAVFTNHKDEVAGWQQQYNGSSTGLGDSAFQEVFEARVSVTHRLIVGKRFQTLYRVGFVELFKVMEACRNDPTFQEALTQRGITDSSTVQIDPWPTGDYGFDFENGRRVQRCIAFRPTLTTTVTFLDGLMVHVDVDSLEVLHVEDFEVTLATDRSSYDVESVVEDYGPLRDDLKPVEITQPEGTSFSVQDNEITWQNGLGWSLMTPKVWSCIV